MAQADTVQQRARDADELIDKMEPPSMFSKMLPKMMKMVPPLMLMGILVLIAGLAIGVWNADTLGDAIGTGSAADMADAQQVAAWLPSLEFLGMGLILFSISVTLLGIATALRTMGGNVVGLILEHEGQ